MILLTILQRMGILYYFEEKFIEIRAKAGVARLVNE